MNYFLQLPTELQELIYYFVHLSNYKTVIFDLQKSVFYEILNIGYTEMDLLSLDDPFARSKLIVYHLDMHVIYSYTETGKMDNQGGEMFITLCCWSNSMKSASETLIRQHSRCNKIVCTRSARPALVV